MALKEIEVVWETFNFKVWVAIGSHRCLAAYIKKRQRRVYRERADPNCAGAYFHKGNSGCGVIWLPHPPTTPRRIGYLAHEMGHAVMDMHNDRGLVLDCENDETFCYAVGYGVEMVMEGCK